MSPHIAGLLRQQAVHTPLCKDPRLGVLEVRRIVGGGAGGGTELVAVRLPAGRVHLRVEPVRSQVDFSRAYRERGATGDLLVSPGSFTGPGSPPSAVGLVLVDGQQIGLDSVRAPWGGFIAQTRDGLRVVTDSGAVLPRGTARYAIQSWPVLVRRGTVAPWMQQPRGNILDYLAVGTTAAGDIVVASIRRGENSGSYASDLAAVLALPESAGGLGVRDAVTVEGGPALQLWLPTLGRQIGAQHQVGYLPNVLHFALRPGERCR